MERESRKRGHGISRGLLRSALALFLSVVVAMGTWTTAFAAEGDAAAVQAAVPRAQWEEALGSLQQSLGKANPVGDWVALTLARSGKPAASRYLPVAEKSVSDGSLRLVTDYARTVLAVNANGANVRSFGKKPVDLVSKIANFEKLTAQGANAPAFALLAFDASGYEGEPNDRWSRDALLKWLVDNRNADGGWSLVKGKSDVDLTAIVLMSLAPYQEREDVSRVTDQALAWLSAAQKPNGGFGNPESSESSAQVLIALTSLGIDPEADARFLKEGRSAFGRLMEFRQADGGFAHVPGGKSDGLSSLYAFLALTAVQRYQDGLSGLYAPAKPVQADLFVYGPAGQLAESRTANGTVLDSLVGLLRNIGVSYQIVKYPQLGAMLSSVGNTASGAEGWWSYAVQRGGRWLTETDTKGMGAFVPRSGDKIYVYYSGADTALIRSVKLDPEMPREGRKIQVTVEKETVDWADGSPKRVISPAEGALIRTAGHSVKTDKDGKAELPALSAGTYTLSVTGYRQGAAPQYLAVERPLEVVPHVKNVGVRIEGDKAMLAQGSARGGTALEALENFLKAKGMSYEVKDSSYGKYLTAIGGTASGQYGGSDGWNFAVKGTAGWIHPMAGMADFLLEEGQELVVYYGDLGAKLPEPVIVTPAWPKPGEPVTVKAVYRELDWETGKLSDPKPLAGALVSAGGVSVTTGEDGTAKLEGLKEAAYLLTVSGYAHGKAPSVVRTVVPLTVAKDYSDQARIPGWAAPWVRTAKASGALLGTGDQADAPFNPRGAVTRAEFVVSLVRAMDLVPVSGSSFKDVPAKAWYAKEIEAASKAGLIAGIAPGYFAPDAKLTREQAAQLLMRALKLQDSGGSAALADADKVSASAKVAVRTVVKEGWMTASNGMFSPKQTMPREQAAVIAVRVLYRPGIGKLGH